MWAVRDFFILSLSALGISCVTCRLIASFIMPHGGIALDPSHFNTTNATALKEAWEINAACIKVGKEIAKLEPDIIFLNTPHGIADLRDFMFYMNPVAGGYADTDNCQCPPCCYNATVSIDVKVTEKILSALTSNKNISGLSGYGPPGQSSELFPLRWGEIIPIHFIPGLNTSKSKFVIMSQPSRRYTEDVQMISELLTLGTSLYEILEAMPESVVVLMSGDLAHTHEASGPYGYSNTSEPFDLACGKWVTSLDSDFLLIKAARIVDKALSCGFTEFVTLHGLMQAGGLHSWHSDLLVNFHPSYYGMMVARFIREISEGCERDDSCANI